MAIKDLRSKSIEELRKVLADVSAEMEKVSQNLIKGKEKNTRKKMQLRKKYARVLTVLNEKKVLKEIETSNDVSS